MKLKVLTALFLFCVFTYLPAQDRPAGVLHAPGERHSSEEARQHYLQGKEFYSLGRYEEARIEFERALESVTPPRLVTETTQEQRKALEIAPSQRLTLEEKEAQKKKEEKKKEEKKKEEKEPEVTKVALTEEAAPEVKETGEREYYIDAGDVLDISVWQIPDLSKSEVIVRPDGKISFPLIGDIKAEGLTLTQLDNIITEKLKTYVKIPEVSIMIRRFGEQANKVVVLGEVPAPGVYRFSGPPTIAEAVASAGGYTKYAVINSIMVIRGDVRTRPELIRVKLAQVLKGRISRNITLKPNDIVYVPRSFIGNVNTFMELIQPAISEYMQTMDARRFHNIMHRN